MDINDYQTKAMTTDVFDRSSGLEVTDKAFLEKLLGLIGESGEFADKVKKIIRNDDGKMDASKKKELVYELGDILWYVATMARYLDTDMDTVAKMNLDKLADRAKRNVIKSQGDHR